MATETFRVIERQRIVTDKDRKLIKALIEEQHRSKSFEIRHFELVFGPEFQPLIRIVSKNLLIEDRSRLMYNEYVFSNGTKIKKALVEFLSFLKKVSAQTFLEDVDSSGISFGDVPQTKTSRTPMLTRSED